MIYFAENIYLRIIPHNLNYKKLKLLTIVELH